MEQKFKPNIWTFFIIPQVLLLFYAIISFIVTAIILNFIYPNILIVFVLVCGGLAISILAFSLINGFVRYKKENYTFKENKIYKSSGNIFSDSEFEVDIDKVLCISIYRPFISNLVIDTETLLIETAGTQQQLISINDLSESHLREKIKSELFKNLKIHSLNESPISLKPSYLGAFSQAFGSFLNLFYSFLVYIFYLVIDSLFLSRQGFSVFSFLSTILFFYLIIAFISSFWSFITSIIRIYFTNYYFYKDFIFCSYGILNKMFFYLPDSKITDLVTTQSFTEKILGLKTITISAPNNPSISQLVQINKNFNINLIKEKQNISKDISALPQANINSLNIRPNPFRYSLDIFLEVLLIAGGVALGFLHPPLLIILLPSISFIFYILNQASEVFFTKYELTEDSVRKEYNFLTSKTSVLINKNITSIRVSQNPFDKFLQTATITFFSLGGSESIKISYIDLNDEINNLINSYIDSSSSTKEIKSELNIKDWILNLVKKSPNIISTLFISIFYFLAFVQGASNLVKIIFGIILLLYILFISLNDFLAHKKAILKIQEKSIIHKYGWWSQNIKIVKKESIKDLVSIKYPLSNKGEIIANIAGDISEDISTTSSFSTYFGNNDSNQINAFYIEDPLSILNEIDSRYVFDKDETNYKFAPTISNSILKSLPFGILLPFIIPFLLIYLYRIKVSFFLISKFKLISFTGIFYKKSTFLLKENIDYFEIEKDFINKVVGNSSINIFTSGNSILEMKLFDIDNADKAFQLLKVKEFDENNIEK